jgi:UDP-glucuronate 4-epimerase
MKRDFTFIDDIVDGVIKSLEKSFKYEIFNLGNDKPVKLEYMISLLEKNLNFKANKKYLPIQP